MRWANRFVIDTGIIDPGIVWALAGISAAVLVTLAILPTDALSGVPAVCPFKRFLGIECYGCGMTRALSAFLHGHIQVALAYNRGVLLTVPLLTLVALLPVGVMRRHA